jgi:hypothetical protein
MRNNCFYRRGRASARLLAGWLFVLLTGGLSFAWAQAPETPPAADEPEIPTVKLTLYPAAETKPALKYRLLPAYWERRPGNAAQFYYRALLLFTQNQGRAEWQKRESENYERWNNQPCEGEVREELKRWLADFSNSARQELEKAVYREECDFDYRLRDLHGTEVISLLLPEIQEMRNFGRYLHFKAKVDIAEGNYDQALESLRWGYQIGKDTASEPLLINGLVGIAVDSMMNGEVEHWIGSPDAPNLYWALASLPQPPIDLRPALEQEVHMPEIVFPFLQDAETAERSPEEWQRLLSRSLREVSQNFQPLTRETDSPLAKLTSDVAVAALALRAYPIAKQELLAQGYDAKKLEKMPVGQVIAIHLQRTVRYLGDEFAKGAYLPTRQRDEYYANLEDRLRKDGYLGGGMREPIPLASLLLPGVGAALSAQSRLERDMAGLQTLEAIRAHLAQTGKLPDKLEEIVIVPVPPNPLTGQPFPYRREGEKAILDLPAPKGRPHPSSAKRYELTLGKNTKN